MKKKNRLILSTFIAFSSILALSSTSLADNIEYKDQISSVNEEYEEYKESKEESSVKKDNYISDNNKNISVDNINEANQTDTLNVEKELDDTEVNEVSVEKVDESKSVDKEKKDFESTPNYEDKKTLNNDDLIEYESKTDLDDDRNKVDDGLDIESNEKSENISNEIAFYSTNTRSRSLNYSNSNNLYIIEKDSAYRYDNKGNKIGVSNSWINIGKDKYFANSKGKIVKGIQRIGLDRFYFANNGVLKTNTKIITNVGAYNIGISGIMNPIKNRWIDVNSNKYHTGSNGSLDKGFNLIENKIYSFDSNGKLEKNKVFLYKNSIITIDNKGEVGKKRNSKIVVDNFEYTSDKNGKVINIKDLRKKPEVVTSYLQGNTVYNKYNNNTTKIARNQWVKLSGNDYRTNSTGQLLFGVHKIGNYYYNFTENGLAKDYKTFYANNGYDGPGRLYSFDKSGKGILLSSNYRPNRDLDVTIGWMLQGMNFNYKYNMYSKRDMIGYADCSSAVYRAMKHGGFISKNVPNGNTETLFDLGRRGRILKQISEKDIRYGDIFVAGVPGKSLGAGGHTGFILDKNTIIHCNWADRGISITPRKGRMGDNKFPVRYYRLVGGKSSKYNI